MHRFFRYSNLVGVQRLLCRLSAAGFWLLAGLLAPPAAVAQGPAADPGSLLDSLVPAGLTKHRIPGAVVAVVRDSQVLALRGYGLADVAGERPVDPAVTGFRVGSLSKLVTTAAVLQLVGQGRLGLRNDVRAFLGDISLDRRFPGDLTLHHLLTHSAGLDDTHIGDAARRPENIIPLDELVRRRFVPQALPPGQGYHYSNYGMALAGLLVERAAGRPFAEYVDQHIFAPLGMTHSTFAQPPPAAVREGLATGYTCPAGAPEPLPLDYSQVAPADALISTGADMARFLLAVLGTGDSLLAPEQRIEFLSQQFSAAGSPFGMAYGWHENMRRGVRTLEHGGDQSGFAAVALLAPGLRLGIFVAQNRREGDLRWEVADALLARFLPPAPDLDAGLRPNPLFAAFDPARYTGCYRNIDYPHHTFEKAAFVLGLRGALLRVREGGPGALLFDDERFVIRQPDLFADPRLDFRTRGFHPAGAKAVTYFTDGRNAFERVPGFARPGVLQLVLLLSILLPAAMLAVLFRRRAPAGAARRWRRIAMLSIVLWLLGVGCVAVLSMLFMNRTLPLAYGPAPLWYAAFTMLNAGAAAAALVLPLAAARSWWGRGVQTGLALTALAVLAGIAVLIHANLLGYPFG